VALPRFHVPDAAATGERLSLPEGEAHHLRHVLRLSTGDAIRAFDGRGREWTATVALVSRRLVEIELGEAVAATPEPPVGVTMAVGLLKGDQMETVVRDTTMLGVVEILPVVSAHVVTARSARGGSLLERWTRVAVASAKQCGRAVVPRVSPPAAFDEVVARSWERVLIAVEPSRAASDHARRPADALPTADTGRGDSAPERSDAVVLPQSALALVGPEGGWADAELEAALVRGAELVDLGPRTLRAEVAPTVLLSVLWARWGWVPRA